MGVHRYYGKAVRFNGYSDGLTVPTGLYRERGVKLRRPATTEPSNTEYSNATRTGRLHIPNETNPLNAVRGAFTIDAYIIPDLGGVVVHKEGSYKLEVGSPFGVPKMGGPTQAGTIKFTIYTSGKTHTIETNFDIRAYIHTQMYQYPDKRYKPQDMTLPRQQLMMVTAQFTEKEMKLYLNTGLVAEMSFGGDKLLLDGNSSDLFIGGRGGEYRGVIESVRISRGIVSPKLEPLTVLDETIGFWDFNDEIQIPEHYFYSHSQSGSPTASRDGPPSTNDGNFNVPGVFVGYDFHNIKNPANNIELGILRIREPTPNAGGEEDVYRGTEKLASMFTGIPLKDIRKQSWYASGTLRTSSDSTFRSLDNGSASILRDYFDDAAPSLPQSSLNLIINHSGTNPDTKTHRNASSSIRFPYFDPAVAPASYVALYQEKILSTAPQRDLDPMVNPVERVRVVAIDFMSDYLWVAAVHPNNDPSIAAPQQSIENRPVLSGLQYHHDDDTPVWVCLGNGDLVLDDGNKDTDQTAHPGQVTRAKDTFTRATFTQGQRFKDKSGNNNEAFFISKMSRTPITPPAHLPSDARFTYFFSPPVGSSLYSVLDADPPKSGLLFWHQASNKTLANIVTGQVDLFRDLSGNYHDFHTDTNTDIWKWEEDSGFFGGRPSYVVNSGASVNGKTMVNMATADGSGKQITRSANGYTIFMMIRAAFHPTQNLRIFGVQGGTNQSYIDMNVAANLTTFGNAGGGGTRPSTLQAGRTMLYAVRIYPGALAGHPLGTPNQVREYVSNVQMPPGVFADGCINTFVDFSDGIFSLLGNVTAINTATKKGTTANYGAPPDFRWSEILIYNTAMTDAEMAQVNGYFLDKYGVI